MQGKLVLPVAGLGNSGLWQLQLWLLGWSWGLMTRVQSACKQNLRG